MEKTEWKELIKSQCQEAGTYRPYFDSVINALAEILVRRDEINEQYEAEGCQATLEHTNKAGATNVAKNPLIMLWNDMNVQALAYWKELGLTSASLKKINGETSTVKRKSALAEALSEIQ